MSDASHANLDHLWSRLQPLFVDKRDQIFAAMSEYGLTPPHGKALTMLVDGPLRMRDIADLMICDASYVTAIVDNLEHLGLAERRPSAVDRRVKEIALTERGHAAAQHLGEQMSSPPAALMQMSPTDRKTIAKILDKLDLDESHSLWPSGRHSR